MTDSRLRYLFLLLASFQPLSGQACIDQALMESYDVRGIASDPEGEILYIEELRYRPDQTGGKLVVQYMNPDKTSLASKKVDFNCRPGTPSFQLIDNISGYVEGVKWQKDQIISYQDSRETIMDVPIGETIFDAGFDNTIRLNWDVLMSGTKLKVNYLFARDNQFFKLRLQKSGAPSMLKQEINDDIVFFKISANNLIFRLFSSPLFVGYSIKDRNLKYFSGPSNLPMMRNEKEVLIRYSTMSS